MREGLCNCLATYDWEGDLDVSRWVLLVYDFFRQCNVEPDVFTVGDGGNGAPKSAEYLKNLLSMKQDLKQIDIFRTVAGYKQLVFGWSVTSSLHTEPMKTMFFGWDNAIRPLDCEWVLQLIHALSRFCGISYGIGYQRSFKKGPDLYAYGISSGLGYDRTSMTEADRISRWMKERLKLNRHLAGMLRDVYPLNVVTQAHLSESIEGVPMRKWIEATPVRGALKQLTDQLWAWYVPAKYLLDIQLAFARSGRLICRSANDELAPS